MRHDDSSPGAPATSANRRVELSDPGQGTHAEALEHDYMAVAAADQYDIPQDGLIG